jgi:hypothetical protein
LLNLDSELSGRGENKDDGTIARSQERLGVDVNDSRKTVSERLSGARLGNTDNVATGEGHGPSLRLNGSRSRETLRLDLVHDISREAGFVEVLDRFGDVTAVDADSMIFPELLDLGGRADSDVGVLLVEVLLELGHGA